jgi:hypothetical protein
MAHTAAVTMALGLTKPNAVEPLQVCMIVTLPSIRNCLLNLLRRSVISLSLCSALAGHCRRHRCPTIRLEGRCTCSPGYGESSAEKPGLLHVRERRPAEAGRPARRPSVGGHSGGGLRREIRPVAGAPPPGAGLQAAGPDRSRPGRPVHGRSMPEHRRVRRVDRQVCSSCQRCCRSSLPRWNPGRVQA